MDLSSVTAITEPGRPGRLPRSSFFSYFLSAVRLVASGLPRTLLNLRTSTGSVVYGMPTCISDTREIRRRWLVVILPNPSIWTANWQAGFSSNEESSFILILGVVTSLILAPI